MPHNVFALYRLPQDTSNTTKELVISLKTFKKEGIIMGLFTFFMKISNERINEIPQDASKCSRSIY